MAVRQFAYTNWAKDVTSAAAQYGTRAAEAGSAVGDRPADDSRTSRIATEWASVAMGKPGTTPFCMRAERLSLGGRYSSYYH